MGYEMMVKVVDVSYPQVKNEDEID